MDVRKAAGLRPPRSSPTCNVPVPAAARPGAGCVIVKGASVMTFKVYSGPAGTDAVAPINKDRMLFKEFPSLDDALSWASHVKDTGRVAVLIEDESGRTFDKREIAAALAHRGTR